MVKKDQIRLKHMLDSANAILSFVKGKARKDLTKNRLLLSAIIREFEIIGEAAGQVSKKTQSNFPELPWKQLVGLRNRLIHAYFDIDQDILWKTIKENLPTFSKILGKVLQNTQE